MALDRTGLAELEAIIDGQLVGRSRVDAVRKLRELVKELNRVEMLAAAIAAETSDVGLRRQDSPGERYFLTVDVAVEETIDGNLSVLGFTNLRQGPVVVQD